MPWPTAGPVRILFIGNSLTFWCGGIDLMFRNWGFDAAAETIPGATLAKLWRSGRAKAKILEGGWHIVVLRDDLPEYPEKGDSASRLEVICQQFNPVLSKFLELVKSVDAMPVMYMAHPYERLAHTSLDDICLAHKMAEKSHDGLKIAPGGLAHSLMKQIGMEDMSLLDEDLEHPSEQGLYLHALCIVACIGREKLAGLQWAPDGMPDSQVQMFKQIAVDSLEAWDRDVIT